MWVSVSSGVVALGKWCARVIVGRAVDWVWRGGRSESRIGFWQHCKAGPVPGLHPAPPLAPPHNQTKQQQYTYIHTYIHTDRQTDRQKLTLQVRSSTNITQVKEYLRKIKALTSAYIINVQVLRPVFLGHMQLFVFIIQAIVPTLQACHYVYIGIIFS